MYIYTCTFVYTHMYTCTCTSDGQGWMYTCTTKSANLCQMHERRLPLQTLSEDASNCRNVEVKITIKCQQLRCNSFQKQVHVYTSVHTHVLYMNMYMACWYNHHCELHVYVHARRYGTPPAHYTNMCTRTCTCTYACVHVHVHTVHVHAYIHVHMYMYMYTLYSHTCTVYSKVDMYIQHNYVNTYNVHMVYMYICTPVDCAGWPLHFASRSGSGMPSMAVLTQHLSWEENFLTSWAMLGREAVPGHACTADAHAPRAANTAGGIASRW